MNNMLIIIFSQTCAPRSKLQGIHLKIIFESLFLVCISMSSFNSPRFSYIERSHSVIAQYLRRCSNWLSIYFFFSYVVAIPAFRGGLPAAIPVGKNRNIMPFPRLKAGHLMSMKANPSNDRWV